MGGKRYLDAIRKSHISINNHAGVHPQGTFVQPYADHVEECTARRDPETAPVERYVIGRFGAKFFFLWEL